MNERLRVKIGFAYSADLRRSGRGRQEGGKVDDYLNVMNVSPILDPLQELRRGRSSRRPQCDASIIRWLRKAGHRGQDST